LRVLHRSPYPIPPATDPRVGCYRVEYVTILAVVWRFSMMDVSTASWLLALLPGGCLRWPTTLGIDSGYVSLNELMGYSGPRFCADLEAFLLSLVHLTSA
jgi:hypothetical protein